MSGLAFSDDAPRGSAKLEKLLVTRHALIRAARDLHGRYGRGGTASEHRDVLRAQLAVEYRARLADHEGRVTQTMVDEAVRTDPKYGVLLDEIEAARGRLYMLYDEVRAVTARIAEHLRLSSEEGEFETDVASESGEEPPAV
jgi:hypothetical protein